MRLGHFKANHRQRIAESIRREPTKTSYGKGLGRSKPFVPGMYERKTPEQVRAIIGTNPEHTFVPATR